MLEKLLPGRYFRLCHANRRRNANRAIYVDVHKQTNMYVSVFNPWAQRNHLSLRNLEHREILHHPGFDVAKANI